MPCSNIILQSYLAMHECVLKCIYLQDVSIMVIIPYISEDDIS